MNRLAAETWQKLEVGDEANLKFREDSITEHNLFTLYNSHPVLKIHRFNQTAEKASGADWEWWVGNDDAGWLAIRVQAKRSHGTQYKYLGHEGENPGENQYDTLIRTSREDSARVFPMHVFYNGWSQSRFPSGEDRTCIKGGRWWGHGRTVADWGCAAMSSYAVRHIHSSGGIGRADVLRYLGQSMPWSEIFQPHFGPHLGPAGYRSFAVHDIAAFNLSVAEVVAMQGGGVDSFIPDDFRPFPLGELPGYAAAVLGGDAVTVRPLEVPTALVAVWRTP